MSQRSGCLGGIFILCASVAVLAYAIAFGDHNAGSTALYKGYVGGIALFLAGLPWSVVLVDGSLGLSESTANMLLYGFPLVNVVVTAWLAFGSRSDPMDGAR